MKATELAALLTRAAAEHGDHEVLISGYYTEPPCDVVRDVLLTGDAFTLWPFSHCDYMECANGYRSLVLNETLTDRELDVRHGVWEVRE